MIRYCTSYRVLDTNVPASVRTAILDLLLKEAFLLLPPLFERMTLLQSLLPIKEGEWGSLSRGQVSCDKTFPTEIVNIFIFTFKFTANVEL